MSREGYGYTVHDSTEPSLLADAISSEISCTGHKEDYYVILQYNQTEQLKKTEYTDEPANSGLKSLPELPSLPDDENLSTPDVSDDGKYCHS